MTNERSCLIVVQCCKKLQVNQQMLANNLKQLELQKPRIRPQIPFGEDNSSSEAAPPIG